jgi:NodT family efflux transporter outer membrane factor (OMF) lipoprotein
MKFGFRIQDTPLASPAPCGRGQGWGWLSKKTVLVICSLLTACEVGPDYSPPPVEAPKAYKETGNWAPAKPNDAVNRGPWWSIYDDPVLDNLEQQIDISNQNLKAAEAAYRNARALIDESRSQLFPTVDLNGSGTRSGGGSKQSPTVTAYNQSVGASWVPDLWGRIRRQVESDVANAQVSEADLALARLSAQSDLATDYFGLRAQDELRKLLNDTVAKDRKALQIVKNQYDAGIVAKADVLTAQTQLENVQAQAINSEVLRAQLEHAIAVLIGKPPAAVTLAVAPLAQKIPAPTAGLPSELLERRPDIAASERQVAVANAQIGVAVSAWFPTLTLSGSYGSSAVQLANLFAAPYTLWSFGPALAETVFDAGLREAQIEAAHATYDQTVANYRQTVLTGFQQVEDELSTLRILSEQAKIEKQVVADARKSEQLTLNQYKEGTVPYSSVLTAQIATLTNEQTALTVRQNRFTASVALVEALGGGWTTSQLTTNDQPKVEPSPVTEPQMQTYAAPPASTSTAYPADTQPHATSNINQNRDW